MKRLVEKLAASAGMEVVAKWRMPTLPLAMKVRKLFSVYNISSVLDVGANEGQYRDFLRDEVGFQGQIYSFEPLPSLAAKLTERARSDPLWTIFPIALGASAGEMVLNEMAVSQFSSFLLPSDEQDAKFVGSNRVAVSHKVTVNPLDALSTKLSDLRRAYLKIDTQGFDLEVLKGAPQVIKMIPALQTEVSLKPIYAGMPSFVQSLSAFGAAGFCVSDLFLVSSDEMGRAVEFDCVMVRRA